MKAAPHPRQQVRLARLRQYGILDTPKESDFDEIVALASAICDAPISVINLIDEHRQWFKAEVGLGVRETPLETSLCSHAILQQDYMEIPDTLADDRTADNPLCLDVNGLRFYAGYLLKTDEGLPLGTLCVLDTKPRHLTQQQREALRVLARQVMHQLELRRALSHQKLLRQEIDHRVKNSLQAVGAYVRQQQRHSHSDEVKSLLSAVVTRIEAVAALHEQLYRADDGEHVDLAQMGERLRTLTAELMPVGIELTINLPPLHVDAQSASALSVIFSEFIANSIKHGFRERTEGEISITSTTINGGAIIIDCADTGIGSDQIMGDRSGSASLGMRIIEASIAQLGSTPVWQSGPDGTRLSFTLAGLATAQP
jgi:two-component sensor histidine kinase